ncbi:MAG: hypothetical protein AVDCRST_MAG53-3035, partial [uncultured Solirubrobacteraceae bacterium]
EDEDPGRCARAERRRCRGSRERRRSEQAGQEDADHEAHRCGRGAESRRPRRQGQQRRALRRAARDRLLQDPHQGHRRIVGCSHPRGAGRCRRSHSCGAVRHGVGRQEAERLRQGRRPGAHPADPGQPERVLRQRPQRRVPHRRPARTAGGQPEDAV